MSEKEAKAKTAEQPAEAQAGEELCDNDLEKISGGGIARQPENDADQLGLVCDCGLEDCDCIKCDSIAHTHA
jgi:hypothetical protein